MKNQWLMVLLCWLLPSSALLAFTRDFDLVNNTDEVIAQVYLARHGTRDSWGDDVMTSDVLEVNQTVHIHFPSNDTFRYWDLMVVFQDGQQAKWLDGFNLSSIDVITLQVLDNGRINAQYHYYTNN